MKSIRITFVIYWLLILIGSVALKPIGAGRWFITPAVFICFINLVQVIVGMYMGHRKAESIIYLVVNLAVFGFVILAVMAIAAFTSS